MFDLMANPEANKYLAAGGDEKFRYDYPLTKDSLVFDIGAFEGDWAIEIWKRYGCRVIMFEPLIASAAVARHKFEAACAKNYMILPCAVSAGPGLRTIDNQDSWTSFYLKGGKQETVITESIVRIMHEWFGRSRVDLIKINAEGEEYAILTAMLNQNLVRMVDHLQIQFHEGPDLPFDAKARYDEIALWLSDTHEIQWRYPFVWESWKRK